jgi:hypothetical protein
MKALFILTPTESKRLIGKAVASMEKVKTALKKANMLVSHGSTAVYVLEEILGKEKLLKLMNPAAFLSGIIVRGTLCSTLGSEKPPIVLLKKGIVTPPAPTMSEMLRDFGADSVVIKGASAVDPEGNAGVLVSHPEGGTIGWAVGSVWARGIHLISPVGLEKLVPSVRQSVSLCGQYTFDYVQGKTVGMVPLVGAEVVTEVKALNILAGVDTCHVASGGVNGSEGSVTLVAEGSKESVKTAIRQVEAVKGEPSLNFRKGICEVCVHTSPAQPKDYDTSAYPKFCRFQGKKEEELPGYLRNR